MSEMDSSLGTEIDESYYPTLVGADQLHERGVTGLGVTIAVVDTGLSDINKALSKDASGDYRVLGVYDAIEDSFSADHFGDPNGHGDHVSSVAVSSRLASNGKYNGLAPDAQLLSVRAFDESGIGAYADIIRGIDFVVSNKDLYGVRVPESVIQRYAALLLLGRPLESGGHAGLAGRNRGRRLRRQQWAGPDEHRCAREHPLRDHRRRHDGQLHPLRPKRRPLGELLRRRPHAGRLREARSGRAGWSHARNDDRLFGHRSGASRVPEKRDLLYDVRHLSGGGGGEWRGRPTAAAAAGTDPERRQVPVDGLGPAGPR